VDTAVEQHKLTALHEAGHAVAAMAIGRRMPHPITIVPTEEAWGSAHVGSFLIPGFYPLRVVEREVQILLAGFAAEDAIGGYDGALESEIDAWPWEEDAGDYNRDHDVSKALVWLKDAGLDEERRWRRLWVLYRRTLRFVCHPDARGAIEMIASRLLEVGTIADGRRGEAELQADFRILALADRRTKRLEHRRHRQPRRRDAQNLRAVRVRLLDALRRRAAPPVPLPADDSRFGWDESDFATGGVRIE
jgi:hypothetical protein